MMEWIPYGQSLAEFLTHVRTFRSVFPEVTLAFGPGGYGVFMFGSSRTRPVRRERASATSCHARASSRIWRALPTRRSIRSMPGPDLIPTLVIASGADVDRVVGPGDIITDDRPLTEYFLLRRMLPGCRRPMAHDTISRLRHTGPLR